MKHLNHACKAALLLCITALLSSCGTYNMLAFASSAKGKTGAQLVEAHRAKAAQTFIDDNHIKYYCYSCDGQPTRTFIDHDGSTVAVWFYHSVYEFSANCGENAYGGVNCTPPYQQCLVLEQRYKLQNNVVVDARLVRDRGDKESPYEKNVCHYERIGDNDVY
ncbi:MAG: hypothetical protein LBF16_12300 [Pseudomonadales bacterium]|jgi:hypothetical protein|nr:hypothetical protein [Pseudomonadales bacterium]